MRNRAGRSTVDRNGPLAVLIADGSRARLFVTTASRGVFHEIEDFVDPAARLARRDLVSDRPGRTGSSATGVRHAMESADPHELEEQAFARHLAAAMHTKLLQDKKLSLVIVAAPRFLGMLRAAMKASMQKRVAAEVAKDWVTLSNQALPSRLRALVIDLRGGRIRDLRLEPR